MNHHLSDCFKCLMAWTHRLRLGVKVAKASPMLSVGQDLVVHHTKASVLAGSTLARLQHVQVDLFLGVIEFLADAFAAGCVAFHGPAAVGLTIETHKLISFPFHFEEAQFAFVVGGVLRCAVAGKPLVLNGGKLGFLVRLDQLFQRVTSQSRRN